MTTSTKTASTRNTVTIIPTITKMKENIRKDLTMKPATKNMVPRRRVSNQSQRVVHFIIISSIIQADPKKDTTMKTTRDTSTRRDTRLITRITKSTAKRAERRVKAPTDSRKEAAAVVVAVTEVVVTEDIIKHLRIHPFTTNEALLCLISIVFLHHDANIKIK